jgi:hypothetical protein
MLHLLAGLPRLLAGLPGSLGGEARFFGDPLDRPGEIARDRRGLVDCMVEEISSVVAFISWEVAESACADSKIRSLTDRTSVTTLYRLCSMALNDRARSVTSSLPRTSTLRVRSPLLITALADARRRRLRVIDCARTTAATRPIRTSADTIPTRSHRL